jgi:hypothetical protein
MFRYVSRVALLAVSSFLAANVGCDLGPSRISAPKVSASAAGAEAIAMYDTNHDGKISGDEFKQCPSLRDIAKDDAVTADMIAQVISTWQKGKIGRLPVIIKILRNGMPLNKAAVTLAPEKFMGKDIQKATGPTDATGLAKISVPTRGPGEPQGASPAFYRIEVTRDGESVPAKYNMETILGLRAAGEMERNPPAFNLVY